MGVTGLSIMINMSNVLSMLRAEQRLIVRIVIYTKDMVYLCGLHPFKRYHGYYGYCESH